MKKLIIFKKIIVAICVLAGVYSCSTVPIIGRKKVNLLPESQLVSMSLSSYREFLDTSVVVASTNAQAQMVKNVGAKVSKAVEKFLKDNGMADRVSDFAWEFNLIQENMVNAWAMAGGKVVFYSGIMPVCRDENGVAVVMGHEIAHVVARHSNERMSHGLITQLGGMALDVALKQKPEATKNIFLSAYGIGSQVAVTLPFSRKHEYEADELGLIFMTMAGYTPQKAIEFWTRMSEMGKSNMPEFLSTHPLDSKRIAALAKLMPKMETYKPK